MSTKILKCPDCKVPMEKKSIYSKKISQNISVWECQTCGGRFKIAVSDKSYKEHNRPRSAEKKEGLTKSLTKHSDWQRVPAKLRNIMPYCPVCYEQAKYSVYDLHGWMERGYRIVCNVCNAEWASNVIDSKTTTNTLLVGAIFSGALSKSLEFPNPNSVLILSDVGNNPQYIAEDFLDEKMTINDWNGLMESDTIFCNYCGTEISEDSEYCKKCGREI